ncbi:MAG: CRISPR-associated endonuclease Cas2 [Candidatus Lokiarchaeota archaeon]|nr:CRISPR-associated endonuclease Cas2 [Candidatus Lokiarchaeota archaeon]
MVMFMKLLVIYDVPEEFDDYRTKIAQVLKNFGLKRIEYSVFFGNSTMNLMETIAMQLSAVSRKIKADIRLFPICNNCLEKCIVVKENNMFSFEEMKSMVGF